MVVVHYTEISLSQLPAVGGEVVVCDAGAAWVLLVRDVGCHQGAGVKPYVADRVPAHREGHVNPHITQCFQASVQIQFICIQTYQTYSAKM